MVDQLIADTKEKIEFAYAHAVEPKVPTPVVFVLDVRDADVSWVAERFADKAKIDEVIREEVDRNTMPTLTFAVSNEQALLLVGQLSPVSVTPLRNAALPETHFLAIDVTAGKLSGRAVEKP